MLKSPLFFSCSYSALHYSLKSHRVDLLFFTLHRNLIFFYQQQNKPEESIFSSICFKFPSATLSVRLADSLVSMHSMGKPYPLIQTYSTLGHQRHWKSSANELFICHMMPVSALSYEGSDS